MEGLNVKRVFLDAIKCLNGPRASSSTSTGLNRRCSLLAECIACDPIDYATFSRLLYETLTVPDWTLPVAECFSGVVVQIVNENVLSLLRSIKGDLIPDVEKRRRHIDVSLVLSKLVFTFPDVLPLCLEYYNSSPSPFEWGRENVSAPKIKKCSLLNCHVSDLDIVECSYKLLRSSPTHFKKLWNWSVFVSLFVNAEDDRIKWLLCECITILSSMSEDESEKLKTFLINDNKKVNQLSLEYLNDHENACIKHPFDNSNGNKEIMKIASDYFVNVAGINLPVYDISNKDSGSLVYVKSAMDNLRSLALSVVSGKAVCLMGPVGCGKTALVEHLVSVTGRKQKHFKKIQLGDQTDSRTLLGTYRCTDVPGEFVWQPGVLTQAVQNGYWLLLEDIDCAPIDVASVLSSLLERHILSVPGYRDSIPIAPGFQLFLTKRVIDSFSGHSKKSSVAVTLLERHWVQINVEPLSRIELIDVIDQLFPQLKTISSRMVDVFMLFSVGNHESALHNSFQTNEKMSPLVKPASIETSEILSLKSGRLTSTRDLIKWCTRAIVDFDVSSPKSALKVLQDAIDIFACSLPDRESRVSLASVISALLGVVETNAEYYCNIHKPKITSSLDSFHVGRATVKRKHINVSDINFNKRKATFSFTRPSVCLLERVSCCVNMNEPVLLVGETGTGKTSAVQHLARETNNKLIVINMNQQSDSADLLGGYKPVDVKFIIAPVRNEFESLFRSYFNSIKNAKFLEHIANCFYSNNWETLLILMRQSQIAAVKHFDKSNSSTIEKHNNGESTKVDRNALKNEWIKFGKKLDKLELQIKSQAALAFSFIEGSLVQALKEGYWVLLDEINLASAETLECLSGLLEGQSGSINLIERGDDSPIVRHKNFTLFACMNPATDVGKRDLPAGLRNRFTEFFVDEQTDKNDLLLLINDYLKGMSIEPKTVESIYKFYLTIRKEAQLNLMDGTGQSPHYSLRTLCRALSAAPKAYCGTIARSLYESMCLSFLTQVDNKSHPVVEKMITKAILGDKALKSITHQPIPKPKESISEKYLNFEGYWICQGNLEPEIPDNYILTPSVRKNLKDLARIISLGKLPILIQGDTSVGKTSLITYLAKASGNRCVRINNHQHTDLQEYVGSYASDASGKLIFKEGILVEAMRKGYWIILDELNLAPTEVLEALNRVLDDNRELFIPETQQVVTANEKFILFATQNPPGLYGGRKLLSRAFRNRFIELHFDEIPKPELEVIMHQRCHMPLSYCKKVLAVMSDLQVRRRGSAAVQGKEGFITLRDLFRWGERYKIASNHDTLVGKFYDWDQHIADEGYLVLAGKVRQVEERLIIQEVLEKHIKRKVKPENLFSLHEETSSVTKTMLKSLLDQNSDSFKHIVWTFNMRRLAILVMKCFHFKEPVLLVGETGCGKTTICQILAFMRDCNLTSINCHMHTESSDFLGGLRPVRSYNNDGKLFEWVDGPLIEAVKAGNIFLADEISLADDSVLERLNSLLEPERQILLAEKGIGTDNDLSHIITAADEFRFIGTMNPGGDYGKKELSPALRNRFTEIWCDHQSSREDLLAILQQNLKDVIKVKSDFCISSCMLSFVDWLKNTKIGNRFTFSIRDLLSWVNFINEIEKQDISLGEAYIHGACLIFLDCFGSILSDLESELEMNHIKLQALKFLIKQLPKKSKININTLKNYVISGSNSKMDIHRSNDLFGLNPFYIQCKSDSRVSHSNGCPTSNFNFIAPTTGLNTLRILRGLQLMKPILLEGSPGVGKTSLVTALAKASGHNIVRINLSDQTDISDLFGADLPTSDGSFAWKEGCFLKALQNGDWILLDELNLAPQPVLEGLNACFDHRREIFIPELQKTFLVQKDTRIFACQNPLRQGGARRGLPKSFLNRFTQVYIDTLSCDDLLFITRSQYPIIPQDLLVKMIKFNSRLLKETSDNLWGFRGSPWELNLRDLQRWCASIMSDYENTLRNCGDREKALESIKPGKYVQLLYVDRMRTPEDKGHVKRIYRDIFGIENPLSNELPSVYITKELLHIGDFSIRRNAFGPNKNMYVDKGLLVLRSQLPVLKSLMQCVKMNWLSILIGPTSCGKSSCIQTLAQLSGVELKILPVTSAMDTADLLGGFEQADCNRHLEEICNITEKNIMQAVKQFSLGHNFQKTIHVLEEWETLKNYESDNHSERNKETDANLFLKRVQQLKNILFLLLDLSLNNDDIKHTIQKLECFYETIQNDQKINAGGKFEWVDSLLVKCLLNGSWLLIDNVNLCSSAVLDRLNCLLEPNGVLTIPERGDDSEIIPHPNFRLFFTIDPKNGEISRAMRNRGVEIYITNFEDPSDFVDTVPILDLYALLDSFQLPSYCHDLFLLNHKDMCSFIQSYNKPTEYHLLQVAFLTHQQVCKGETLGRAILNSFYDVYIKSRKAEDFSGNKNMLSTSKHSMLKKLEDNLQNHFGHEEIQLKPNCTPQHTFSCVSLSRCVNLARIKQEAFLIECALNRNHKDLKELGQLLYDFYHTSTMDNLTMRHEYLTKIIESWGNKIIGSHCKIINDLLFHTISNSNIDSDKYYLWDMELLPECEARSICESSINASNKLCQQLNFQIIKLQTDFHMEHIKSLSIFDYSKNMSTNKFRNDVIDSPLLKNCAVFLDLLRQLIDQILELPRPTKMSNTDWSNFTLSLNWYQRFYRMSQQPLFKCIVENNKKKKIIDEVVVNDFILHYKWVIKGLYKSLISFNIEHVDTTASIKSLIESINKSIANSNSPLKSISKHMRLLSGQSKVNLDSDDFNLSSERDNYFDKFPSVNLLNRSFDGNNILELASSGQVIDCHQLTIDNVFNNPQEIFWKEIPHIDKNNEDESEAKSEIVTPFIYDAQLWPMQHILLNKIINILKIHLSTNPVFDNVYKQHTLNNDFWRGLLELVLNVPLPISITKFLHPKLSFLLNNWTDFYQSAVENPSMYMGLAMEIWGLLAEYQLNTPSVYAPFWLKLNELNSMSETDFKDEPVSLSFPHITYSTIHLTMDMNSNTTDLDNVLASTSLTVWKLQSKQLKKLQKILVKNMITFSCLQFKYLIQETVVATTSFHNFIFNLERALSKKNKSNIEMENDKSSCLSKRVDNCLSAINALYENKEKHYTDEMLTKKNCLTEMLSESSIVCKNVSEKLHTAIDDEKILNDLYQDLDFNMSVGCLWILYSTCNIMIYDEIGSVDVVKKNRLKQSYMIEDVEVCESFINRTLLRGIIQGNFKVPNDKLVNALKTNSFDQLSTDEIFNMLSSENDGNLPFITTHNIHPHCQEMMKKRTSINDKLKSFSGTEIYRPDNPSYLELSKELSYFCNTLGSSKILTKHYHNLKVLYEKLTDITNNIDISDNSSEIVKNALISMKKVEVWKFSLTNFIKKLSKKFLQAFPEIVKPLKYFLLKLIYGFDIVVGCLNKLISYIKFGSSDPTLIQKYSENLVNYPVLDINYQDPLKNISEFSTLQFKQFLNQINLSREIVNVNYEKNICYSILKIHLKEIHCKVTTDGFINADVWTLLCSVLDELVILWQNQQDVLEKKKIEEDSLYVIKNKSSNTNVDDENEKEVSEMFPAFTYSDFADFKIFDDDSKTVPSNTPKDAADDIHSYFSSDDISLITSLHSNIVQFTARAEWMPMFKTSKMSDDYLSLVLDRYKIFSSFIEDVRNGLKESLDSMAFNSLFILVAHARSRIDGENYLGFNEAVEKPNFYHSPWVQETKKCLPLLESVKSKTISLLEQWPDFPTLKDIVMIIDRILKFPVTSPVSRFLTGLELLRDKIEDWNKGAHKNNNMNDLACEVAQCIVTWRKLELSNWKESLNYAQKRLQSEANKWWFHIYTLVDCYINSKPVKSTQPETGDTAMKPKQFINAMQQFIEKSPLVEFEIRLNILYTFHCHALQMPPSSRRDDLICILWNIYNYYNQFSTQITKVMKEKRNPIEKKLKDFVKICTWERDLSYWAVKDIIFKSQKTLHKYIKEFEGVLKLQAFTFLVSEKSDENTDKSVGLWDRPKRTSAVQINHYAVDAHSYVISQRIIKKCINDFCNPENVPILSKLGWWAIKAKDLCKETITKSMYPQLIQSLDGTVTQIIETAQYLRTLEVSPSLPKEKQKSLAKNQLQQKRKGLTDLFRTLSQIGLMYKTGLMELTIRQGNIINYEIKPLNLDCALSYFKNKRCDASLLSIWQDCDIYFQRCIARMETLSVSLIAPSSKLGSDIMDRIKGYAAHFMLNVQEQKTKLGKHSRKLCHLRHQLTQIIELCETQSVIPNQSNLRLRLDQLGETYSTIRTTMQQFDLVVCAYPDKDDEDSDLNDPTIQLDSVISQFSKTITSKDDSMWNCAASKVKQILHDSMKQKESLNKIKAIIPSIFAYGVESKNTNKLILSKCHLDTMNAAINKLQSISCDIKTIISLFNVGVGKDSPINVKLPIVNSLVHLDEYITKTIEDCTEKESDPGEDVNLRYICSNGEFLNDLENLTNFSLVIIQDLYKDCNVTETPKNVIGTDDDDDSSMYHLKENHLKKELHESLCKTMSHFHLSRLSEKLDSIMNKLSDTIEEEYVLCRKQLLRYIPLLEQVSLFAQYFLTQEVATYRMSCKMFSIVLNIFTELVQKGFCTPEFPEESGEQKGEGKLSGGMGLADGEGEKDVSDQIENQDQLEDAHKAGEENKKEDQKDCKEEANGIEMSDNFESHLQDVDEKNDSEKDSDDEDDAEKEMGETEDFSDRLDQQLWGSEKEDDADEDKENSDKNEKGSGVPLPEKQLEAKLDNDENDDGKGDDSNKKKQKPEINELDEPEVDDDQVDPFHHNQKQLPEPEPMEIPDSTKIDDNEDPNEEQDDENNENPFEIDKMKDKQQREETTESKNEKENKDDPGDDGKSDASGDDSNEDVDMETQNDKIEEDVDDIDESDPVENENDDPDREPENDGEQKENKDPTESQAMKKDEEKGSESDDQNEDETVKNANDETPSNAENIDNANTERGSKDMVDTNPTMEKDENAAPFEQSQEQQGEEKDGFGQSELSENQQGHMGNRKDKPQHMNDSKNIEMEKKREKRNKPGETDDDRALGNINEPVNKKMKTLNIQNKEEDKNSDENEGDGVDENKDDNEADIYQHVKQAKEKDYQVSDAATEEQAEKQLLPNNPEQEGEKPEEKDNFEMDMADDDEDELEDALEQMNPENITKNNEKRDAKGKKSELKSENTVDDTDVEVEGEKIMTLGVERGNESTFHTKLDMLKVPISAHDYLSDHNYDMKQALQHTRSERCHSEESAAWHTLWGRTSSQARMLTEKLRLVLEPTGLSRLAGDYRSGKRINMRRVIPYIASHFRKDRIWLRRTKPAKREYHIAVAIDDSSSMCDNQSKELAFESLALISQALNLLEAGDLAVLSFGESTKIIHPFTEQFTENSGPNLIQNLTFKQTRTRTAQMLDFTLKMFEELSSSSNAPNAKLLLIVSDGRSIFSEGETKMLQTVRRVRQHGVFIVYLIVDNPANNVSIMDIRTPTFNADVTQVSCISSYMDKFPFPFYLILRDITALPAVLSDAMRQWFELAANMDSR